MKQLAPGPTKPFKGRRCFGNPERRLLIADRRLPDDRVTLTHQGAPHLYRSTVCSICRVLRVIKLLDSLCLHRGTPFSGISTIWLDAERPRFFLKLPGFPDVGRRHAICVSNIDRFAERNCNGYESIPGACPERCLLQDSLLTAGIDLSATRIAASNAIGVASFDGNIKELSKGEVKCLVDS
jgi:hypothetical protein